MTLPDFSACRVAIVGDAMLDAYLDGHVGRLSPEAPVPVLRYGSERLVAGGAAHVAASVAALGAEARLVAAVGDDEDGLRLERMLAAQGVRTEGLVRVAGRPTTRKSRVMSGRHQIVRIDREEAGPLPDAARASLIEAGRAAIADADLLVLSDYGKGVCGDALLRALLDAAAAIPSIVDPKRRDVEAYRGASLVTPNRAELAEATGLPALTDGEVEHAARALAARIGAAVLVTRSERGMSFVSGDEAPIHLPTFAREVFDVSGAGDTVVATLAVALAAGMAIPDAMRLANQAAGIVVGKIGTATVSWDELARAVAAAAPALGEPPRGALVTLQDACAIRDGWRRAGLSVGFTNGCFDLLHPGHVSLLEQARGACDRLIVALNSDASVARLKGPARPVQDEAARARVVGALAAVDLVLLFAEDTPEAAIRALSPDLLVKGADYAEAQVVGAALVRAAGGRVMLARLEEGHSTSRLVSRSQG